MKAAGMVARAASLVVSLQRHGGPLLAAMMALQVVLAALAVIFAVMLHGDGAFFVYAIAAEAPWALKWSALSTRVMVYLLTVVPTASLAGSWGLSGEGIARVYAGFFYGVPVVQFALAWLIAETRRPALAVLLTAQYAFGTGFGFGYPSEILLAPGFLWIALAALGRTRPLFGVAAPAVAGLVFTHELAIPSALLACAYGYVRWSRLRKEGRSETTGFVAFALVVAAAGLAWLLTHLAGGGTGAAGNGIYVFDPRRVLNNPTLWALAAITSGVLVLSGRRFGPPARLPLAVIAATPVALGVVALGSLWLNFAQGRYDSARTLVAISMTVLGGVFIVLDLDRPALAALPGPKADTRWIVVLAAALAVQGGASLAFLVAWSAALHGFASASGANQGSAPTMFVTASGLEQRVGPREAQAIEQLDFSWTWPFRSIVVAPDFAPAAMLVDDDTMSSLCQSRDAFAANPGRIPQHTVDDLLAYACSKPAPPDRRYLRSWVKRLLGLD